MAAMPKADELRRLINQLDPAAVRHFQGATQLCVSRTHYDITPDHLLMRMLDEATGDVARIFSAFKVDRAPVRRALQRVLDGMPTGQGGKPSISPKLVELLQSAAAMGDELGMSQIRTGLILLAIVLNPEHTKVGEFTPELQRIDADQLRDHFAEIVAESSEQPSGEPGAAPSGGGPGAGDSPALQQFTHDLTAKAQAGQIDPVFGRDAEIRQMIDIFARRRKNNPILVGEPGTGKTAIVEGLALRISQGDVPPSLKDVKLITLDIGLLQAGAGVKGEFENRLKSVIKEIKASPIPIITFIDEAHTLIGAGGQAGGSDAANLLKPALARGELRTVAATTWAEYKKYFEKDAALERRFQLVRCEEPSAEDAIVMLRGLRAQYESHHKVIVLDEAVAASVNLSKRYISGRFLPDKAVDLLDTAAARVAVGLSTRPGVLDDLDRKLTNLDTAIEAIRRDEASGVAIDTEGLAQMEAAKASTTTQREQVEAKWKAEVEAVNRIRKLRAEIGARAEGQGAGGEGARGEGRGASEGGTRGEGRGASDEPRASARADSRTEMKPAELEAARAEARGSSGGSSGGSLGDSAGLREQIVAAMADLARIQGEEPLVFPHVDESTVAAVISDWTGIPVGSMVKDEIQAILQLEDRLRSRVVGQDHALTAIAQKLRASKAGVGNPGQPMGVFLCVGPSGVGKTELALAVADLLFGGDRFLTSINMSEFMEKHTVSQLKGSPPGYIGYGEGGVLTEAARQHPYSVILLDEVEKAHPDVMNLFYQVFDKGVMADGEGRVINFKNTVILLTSNLATDVIQQYCESGEPVNADELREAIYPHLREHFKPALVARMTVIPFLTLGQEILKMIARMKLGKLGERLTQAHRLTFKVDDAVYDWLASNCKQVDLGARQIDHLIEKLVMPRVSCLILEKMTEDTMPAALTMGLDEAGEFTYTFSG